VIDNANGLSVYIIRPRDYRLMAEFRMQPPPKNPTCQNDKIKEDPSQF
jgi:hypothetical protein